MPGRRRTCSPTDSENTRSAIRVAYAAAGDEGGSEKNSVDAEGEEAEEEDETEDEEEEEEEEEDEDEEEQEEDEDEEAIGAISASQRVYHWTRSTAGRWRRDQVLNHRTVSDVTGRLTAC
jgi:hypothetical protein